MECLLLQSFFLVHTVLEFEIRSTTDFFQIPFLDQQLVPFCFASMCCLLSSRSFWGSSSYFDSNCSFYVFHVSFILVLHCVKFFSQSGLTSSRRFMYSVIDSLSRSSVMFLDCCLEFLTLVKENELLSKLHCLNLQSSGFLRDSVHLSDSITCGFFCDSVLELRSWDSSLRIYLNVIPSMSKYQIGLVLALIDRTLHRNLA